MWIDIAGEGNGSNRKPIPILTREYAAVRFHAVSCLSLIPHPSRLATCSELERGGLELELATTYYSENSRCSSKRNSIESESVGGVCSRRWPCELRYRRDVSQRARTGIVGTCHVPDIRWPYRIAVNKAVNNKTAQFMRCLPVTDPHR